MRAHSPCAPPVLTRPATRRLRVLLALALTLAASTAGAGAQSSGANEWSMDSTLAQHAGTGPAPGKWGAEGTLGAQFLSGRSDTRGYDLDMVVAYTTPKRMLIRLDAEWRRADARLRTGDPMTVLDDTRFLSLSAIPKLGTNAGVFVSGILRQDERAKLDLRTMVQVGPYFEAIASPTVQLSVAPFVGLGHQSNARTSDGEGIEAFGGVVSMTWRVSKTARAEVYWTGHRVFGDATDHAWQANASLMAALTKHLALKVAYNIAHEGIVPLLGAPRQHALTTGVSVVFPHRSAPKAAGSTAPSAER